VARVRAPVVASEGGRDEAPKALVGALDVEALRRYCEAVELARRARAEWVELGSPLTSPGSKNQLKTQVKWAGDFVAVV
jgi:hypothetical protein